MYFEHCTPSRYVSKVEMFRRGEFIVNIKVTLDDAKVTSYCLFF